MAQKCDYGCGQLAIVLLSNGKHCCENHCNKCPAIRSKNSEGLKKAYALGTKNCKHLDGRRGWSKGLNLVPSEELFVMGGKHHSHAIKKHLLRRKLVQYECAICKIIDWLGKPLTLELDHINGDPKDHRLENLRLLCLNCHSQTPTFRSRRRK